MDKKPKNLKTKALLGAVGAAALVAVAGAHASIGSQFEKLKTVAQTSDNFQLARNQTGHGTDSNRGRGRGGSGPGNPGNDKPVGNAGSYSG